MAKGIIDADLDDLTPTKLLFLIRQIMECLSSETDQSPQLTTINDTTMLLEIDEYRFMIEIKDLRRFS
jgi:hypothetical protein